MDAQWRWTHIAKGNCIQGSTWSSTEGCALEGMTLAEYSSTCGVSTVPGGVKLKFKFESGPPIGSRLYMMESEDKYKMFKLLNREFTIDVDVSTLGCGLNGAVYFVEMQADGGLGTETRTAGAKHGTGYCDAQCPHDLKFIHGQANSKDWHVTKTGPIGHYGSCCSEMDIWEANKLATAYTAHPCETMGPKRCEGEGRPAGTPNTCGDTPSDCKCCGRHHLTENCPCCGRYKGVCDKDGCDFNSYRLGNKTFYGKGPGFTLDTSKPMTIVTQFITSDGTDAGDLTEIRRLYVQDGKVIKNSASDIPGLQGDSLTDKFCAAQKTTFGNRDDFAPKGGLKGMGKSLARGMVLVLSLWDDELTKMNWLDSRTPSDKPITKPGVLRGPCSTTAGDPATLRSQYGNAFVKYSNIMVGEIGSTYGPKAQAAKQALATATVASPAAAPGGSVPVATTGSMPVAAAPVATAPVATAPMATAPAAMPVATPMVAPVASPVAAAPVTQPAAAPVGGSSGMCCTSGKDAGNKCGSCWKGSAVTSGFCASQAHCGGCGGAWCPSGVTFALFEEPAGAQRVAEGLGGGLGRLSASLAACGAALLALLAAGTLAMLRAGPQRSAAARRRGERYGQLDPAEGLPHDLPAF